MGYAAASVRPSTTEPCRPRPTNLPARSTVSLVGWFSAVINENAKYGNRNSLPDLKFVSSHSDTEDLEKRLGKAEFVENIDGGVTRIYRFPRYNLRVGLKAGKVEMIGIVDYERYPYKPDQK